LVIGLGGMWHVPTVRLTVDHDLPVDVAFMQRGRVCWNTRLVGGEGRVERDYAVRVPERVQRRGFDQLMVTPVEPSGSVRLSGLRLDDS
jgi:hypothetical protein